MSVRITPDAATYAIIGHLLSECAIHTQQGWLSRKSFRRNNSLL